jgi:hypothetical protein
MNMGDGYVQMPVAFFEHHAYPTAYLRAYLGKMRKEGYKGGVDLPAGLMAERSSSSRHAPRADEMVRRYLHDCEDGGIAEIQARYARSGKA